MANINIRNGEVIVNGGDPPVQGTQFPVEVEVNNREVIEPLPGSNSGCQDSRGRVGHLADVSMRITKDGVVVCEDVVENVCTPLDTFSENVNPIVRFLCTSQETGTHVAEVRVNPVNGPTDTATVRFEVLEQQNVPENGDNGNGNGDGSKFFNNIVGAVTASPLRSAGVVLIGSIGVSQLVGDDE